MEIDIIMDIYMYILCMHKEWLKLLVKDKLECTRVHATCHTNDSIMMRHEQGKEAEKICKSVSPKILSSCIQNSKIVLQSYKQRIKLVLLQLNLQKS